MLLNVSIFIIHMIQDIEKNISDITHRCRIDFIQYQAVKRFYGATGVIFVHGERDVAQR